MIRAACFDLDGTLVDSELLWARATHDYLRDLGCELALNDLISIVYGHAWSSIHARLVRLFPDQFKNRTAKTTAGELQDYYLRHRVDPTAIIIPSSVECLRRLAKKIPVTIVSGSPRDAIQECIELMGIEDCISFFIGSEDYAVGKPDPACYRLAAERLRLPPEECVVFEDSTAGVRSAKAAGMYCVALKRLYDGPAQDLNAADVVMTDLAEFKDL